MVLLSLYELKPRFQNFLRPFVQKLANLGVTANQVTIAAMIVSILTGGLIFLFPTKTLFLFLIPIVLFVRMGLNAIDGMLAREHQMKSALGNILNELGDVISDAALYLPFAFISGISSQWIVVIVMLSIISEMTGVLGFVIGASRRYDGPMGKSDRAFLFGLLALLIAMGMTITSWVNGLLALVSLLICVNIMRRIQQALKEVS